MTHMLIVVTTNSTYRIIVSEDIGEMARKEWKEWNENITRDMHDLLEVDGMCDSADRVQRSMLVLMEQIEGIDFHKL